MLRSSVRLTALLSLLSAGILFQSGNAFAVQIINKSELKIGAAILHVEGEKKTPLFIKILQPGASLDFTPEMAAPYLVSVKVFDTDQTVRMENVKASDVIQFKKGKLKRLRKKS